MKSRYQYTLVIYEYGQPVYMCRSYKEAAKYMDLDIDSARFYATQKYRERRMKDHSTEIKWLVEVVYDSDLY